MTIEAGTRLGNYEVLSRLGEGGMGQVYRARDHRLQRDVALKIISQDLAEHPEQLRRFTREAQAASALNHPNILTIHDFDETSSPPYLVMELVDGRTLQEILPGQPMAEAEIRRIGSQLADGLAKAHDAGIVHRDLKPANVMVTGDGFVKILDFGLAKRVPESKMPGARSSGGGTGHDATIATRVLDPSGSEKLEGDVSLLTEPGVVLGTVGYMSPEQAQGLELDDRSDQFSLGVMLYEMATGRRAFERPTAVATLAAILGANPEPVSSLNPQLSAELSRLIHRLLEKAPDQRLEATRDIATILRTPTQELEPTRRMESTAGRDAVGAAPSPRRRPLWPVAAGLAVIGALSWLLVSWLETSSRSTWAREEAMPQLRQLLEGEEFTDAWLLAGEVEQVLPGDAEVQELRAQAQELLTASTDPPGASIEVRDYDQPDGSWISLGVTPLEQVSVPRDYLHWRIRREGFEEVQIAAHPMMWSSDLPLFKESDVPRGMVRISPGRYQSAGDPPVGFGAFWLDRYEVKNKDFQAFVDAGGYENPEYWTEPFLQDGREIPWQEAVDAFRDRTGQPGPATWELGSYPEGRGDYPVRGVSWFEASAYARFAGKSLPTVHHWRHAAGLQQTMFANRLLASNIGRPNAGPLPSSGAMDAYGTYDLAGNVKEWCSNPSGELRFTLGGSWPEPRYLFAESNVQSPFERSEQQGFRCALYDEEPVAELAANVESLIFDFKNVEPVADELFEAYRRFYAYDRSDLGVEPVSGPVEERHWHKEVVSYQTAYGDERIPLHLFLPKNAEPPYQVVVFFPATFALMLPSSEFLDSSYADFIARSGRALAYPIYQRTYERRIEKPLQGLQARRDLIIQWAKDVQRTVDYLETRDDIDTEKLGYYGLSLGAVYGPIFTALEERFKVSLLIGGGLSAPLMGFPSEANPVNFAPRSTLPTLMINGRYDFNYPIATSVEPLHQLFGAEDEDKVLEILESAHIPPRNEAFRLSLAWLDRHLGSP